MQSRRRLLRSAAGPKPVCLLALGLSVGQLVSLLWLTEELRSTEELALRCQEQKQAKGPLAKNQSGHATLPQLPITADIPNGH